MNKKTTTKSGILEEEDDKGTPPSFVGHGNDSDVARGGPSIVQVSPDKGTRPTSKVYDEFCPS
jgi:hypothetical protein